MAGTEIYNKYSNTDRERLCTLLILKYFKPFYVLYKHYKYPLNEVKFFGIFQ